VLVAAENVTRGWVFSWSVVGFDVEADTGCVLVSSFFVCLSMLSFPRRRADPKSVITARYSELTKMFNCRITVASLHVAYSGRGDVASYRFKVAMAYGWLLAMQILQPPGHIIDLQESS